MATFHFEKVAILYFICESGMLELVEVNFHELVHICASCQENYSVYIIVDFHYYVVLLLKITIRHTILWSILVVHPQLNHENRQR